MSLDVDALQKEIESLRGEKFAAQERIHLYNQRGRGRGRGRGLPGRGFINGRPSYQDRYEDGKREDPKEEEAGNPDSRRPGLSAGLQARLGSRPSGEEKPRFGGKDEHDHRVGRAAWKRRMDDSYNRDEEEAAPSNAEPLPGSNTGRLASAVVTDASQPVEEVTRRPDSVPANPEVKRRNKRLFGALLGTLQKFQEEDQRFKRSRLAQNRAEAETRAAEKAVVEQQRLKEKHKQDMAKARVDEINKKRELECQLHAKEYEMLMAKRIAQELKTTSWLRTAAGPSLLWLPKKHNKNTLLLLEQRAIDLDAWKDEQLQKIEKQKAQILDRFKPLPQPLVRPSRFTNDTTEVKDEEMEENDEREEGEAVEEPIQMETPLENLDDRFAGEEEENLEAENKAEMEE